MLSLLRNILRGDFSEYNAKNYQAHTRYALLNLHSYAYDHEVRLAARMVLDYVSARLALSSNDLRRMVPFRRRNEGKNVTRDERGFMQVSLLEMTGGADPMAQHFAILAGNTRIYERGSATRAPWHIKTDEQDGNDAVMYALCDYRLPPSVHDLFVNDLHRRFYQRLHRVPQDDVEVTGRNCDNQVSDIEGVYNYGVAPDFACGPQLHLPDWVRNAIANDSGGAFGSFKFVNRGSAGKGPGFYLALLQFDGSPSWRRSTPGCIQASLSSNFASTSSRPTKP